MGRPKWEMADVFRQSGAAYRSKHQLSVVQYKAMRAIEQCRTAVLGGHIDGCDQCGHLRFSYNSCRNRHCPKCHCLKREAWLEKRCAELLPVPYFHLVFTLPAELQEIVSYNARLLYGALFRQSWAALRQLAKDPKYLGAQTGMLAVLHSWGQNLHYHPHVHCLVPAGGLSFDTGKWKSSRKKYLVPVQALSVLFRGKFVSVIRQFYKSGKLNLSGLCQAYQHQPNFHALLTQMMAKDWVVYAKPPFAGARHLLSYLGRYTHRVAISNHRIVDMNEKTVSFRWRDYADGNRIKVMQLSHEEFIRRFLQHVLPNGFCKIRYYGILANRNRRASLAACCEALEIPLPKVPVQLDWQDRLYQRTGIDLSRCPCCGKGNMVRIGFIVEARAPPPSLKKRGALNSKIMAVNPLN